MSVQNAQNFIKKSIFEINVPDPPIIKNVEINE
jgi:hypothetical protein